MKGLAAIEKKMKTTILNEDSGYYYESWHKVEIGGRKFTVQISLDI